MRLALETLMYSVLSLVLFCICLLVATAVVDMIFDEDAKDG